ncbi:uncharacterized protein LOC129939045 [Eupeodes corollae]|uniref:uncharacterized protein LOC129939045 n=1 Tax=Eupeodes corollae TaxID=290404 RepID=UPI00249059D3|nr:uncharacterized protein LOC129939045 [Eupeodes corollae]
MDYEEKTIKLLAGIHIADKPNDFLQLENLDGEGTIYYLKTVIALKLDLNADQLDIVYYGVILDDDTPLSHIEHEGAVHCFKRTKRYEPYIPKLPENCETEVQSLFNVISNIQINVNSRVNILQKILAEYPEFRRNLGAQALIRDSVLFNTLHQPEVVKNIAKKYPIICEAAAFIVETVKKELARNSNYVAEIVSDTTTSSEEENSGTPANQSEQARIRRISRHQLAAALQQAGTTSMNSLSDIAQRNTGTNDSVSATNPQTPQASTGGGSGGGRILSSTFSNALARALGALGGANNSNPASNTESTEATNNSEAMQWMDSDPLEATTPSDDINDLPARYRDHQYADQLRLMSQMGFTNYAENISYLTITNGNVENAVNLIMGTQDTR